MNLIKKLFQQRKSFLYNGAEVKEGDEVSFVNSDGIKCTDKIRRRKDGTLFFWNTQFSVQDYGSAYKEIERI